MPITIHDANDADLTEALRLMNAEWGQAQDFAAYEATNRTLLATPWGRRHFHVVVAKDAAGRIVSTYKRYRLDMRLDGRPIQAVALGAIFTPEALRGRGYASAMIEASLAEEAAAGAWLALLFSEIDPAFYERLGFREIGTQVGRAAALAGPGDFRPMGEGDRDRVLAWFSAGPAGLGFEVSPDYWAYLATRLPTTVWVYAPGGGPARGAVAASTDEDTLNPRAVGFDPDVAPRTFYRALRALAHALGLAWVEDWLPPETAEAGFTFSPPDDGVPMARLLGPGLLPERTTIWSLHL